MAESRQNMKTYNVIFTLYGGIKTTIIEAMTEQEAIEKAKNKMSFLPVCFKECVELV